jgi:hypothetical protein
MQEFRTQAVLQVTDLDRDYLDRAIRNAVPPEEMVFYCGHLNIHALIKPGKVFTLLLCRLRLGRIGMVGAGEGLADSVLLESESGREALQYNFMLRDRQNYQVEYEAQFAIGSEKEFLETEFECMNCQNRRARVHCASEGIHLCEECSKDHHGRRMMQGHQLERLDKVNTLPACPQHGQPLRHYCAHCRKYLCGGCLQKGSSHGSTNHPVAPIPQLYADKREQTEAAALRHKERLGSLLRTLELKREEVEHNYEATKHAIEMVAEQSLKTLKHLHAERSFLLRSDEIELRMLSEKLEWAKTFIRFQERNLKPIFYFQSQDM